MAKDDQRRKNFWDDEEEGTSIGISQKRAGLKAPPGRTGATGTEDIDRLIHEAKVLMEQTHQLYQQYFNGIEKRTPVEKIRLLETKVAELQRTNTSITTARFKLTQFLAQYHQMKDLWERKLRDRERK